MSAPESYFNELREALMDANTEDEHNILLDQWFDAATRATDYDAIQWGFDPRTWGGSDRKKMESNIASARSNTTAKGSTKESAAG